MARMVKNTSTSSASRSSNSSGGCGTNAALLLVLGLAAVLFSLASFRRTWTVLDYDLVSAKCFQALSAAGTTTSSVRGGSGSHGGGLAVADLPAAAGAGAGAAGTDHLHRYDKYHNNVDHLVTKRFGTGWEVWDRKSVLHEELGDKGTGGTPCNWQEYKAFGRDTASGGGGGGGNNNSSSTSSSGIAPVFMCLYPPAQDRFVSGQIQKRGSWGNCNSLTKRLHQGGGDATDAETEGTKNLVYMDVGANIGSCVVQILSTTDAKVVAFEPNPKNLFRLTSTLLNLPEEMKNRVTLFPVALGSEPAGTATIVSDPRNAGNTQVVRATAAAAEAEAETSTSKGGAAIVQKGVTGATVATHNIPVERMDDLLSKDLKVDLLKLDVQGFECFVLAGMKSVLANTRKMFFEVEEELLTRFRDHPGRSCSGALLVRTLQRAGFQVIKSSGAPAEDLTSTSDADLAVVTFRNQDMFAERLVKK
jgi:FkbM family methyltransferase